MARQMKRKAEEENAEAGPSKRVKTNNATAPLVLCLQCHRPYKNDALTRKRHFESAFHLKAVGRDAKSGADRVRCPGCDYNFSRRDAFLRHVKNLDSSGNPKPEPEAKPGSKKPKPKCSWIEAYKRTQDPKYLDPDDDQSESEESEGEESETLSEPTFSPDDTTFTSGPSHCFVCSSASSSTTTPTPITSPLPDISAEKIAEMERDWLNYHA